MLSISTAIGGSAERAMDCTSDFKRLWLATPHTCPSSATPSRIVPPRGVGKGAYLTPEPGRTGALELRRETFAEGEEVGECLFVHTAIYLLIYQFRIHFALQEKRSGYLPISTRISGFPIFCAKML